MVYALIIHSYLPTCPLSFIKEGDSSQSDVILSLCDKLVLHHGLLDTVLGDVDRHDV